MVLHAYRITRLLSSEKPARILEVLCQQVAASGKVCGRCKGALWEHVPNAAAPKKETPPRFLVVLVAGPRKVAAGITAGEGDGLLGKLNVLDDRVLSLPKPDRKGDEEDHEWHQQEQKRQLKHEEDF